MLAAVLAKMGMTGSVTKKAEFLTFSRHKRIARGWFFSGSERTYGEHLRAGRVCWIVAAMSRFFGNFGEREVGLRTPFYAVCSRFRADHFARIADAVDLGLNPRILDISRTQTCRARVVLSRFDAEPLRNVFARLTFAAR
jgi:hypothetical protein